MIPADESDGLWCPWLERATGAAVVAVIAAGVYLICGG